MSPIRYFLDTHVLVWWFDATPRLTPDQRRVLDNWESFKPFGVSDISLMEIGCLVSSGRLQLGHDLKTWLGHITAQPLVQLCRITPAVVAEVSKLPKTMPSDPADQIIVATARVEKAVLLTQDRRIIESCAIATL